MRVVVFGATGNIGSSLVPALARETTVDEVIGVARRRPATSTESSVDKVTWLAADITTDPLDDVVAGADAVVHLAWKIQPQHDHREMFATNVAGTGRVLQAVERQRVPAFVCASSVGAYAPGPKSPRVDESWPATGVQSSVYSRHKAVVERMLDDAEALGTPTRIVRMRTSLVFQRRAASEVHRLFLGRWAPRRLPRPARVVPRSDRLMVQATHADDVADAYVRAVLSDARGAFNIAAEPVLTPALIAAVGRARIAPIPLWAVRSAMWAGFHSRALPIEPGWIDMGVETPIMSCVRASSELGWRPKIAATDALAELLSGMAERAGGPTPPLTPSGNGPVVALDAARRRSAGGQR